MLNTILIVLRTISLIFGGHEQVALENLALREQLDIFQRSVRHPKIRQRDRLFWVYPSAVTQNRPMKVTSKPANDR
jgi:hypothetical protein